MDTQQGEENVVSGIYDGYQETQKEVMAIEIKKTRAKLFTIAAIVFVFDFLALAMVDLIIPRTIFIISIVPLAMVGLALLSMKEPMLAIVLAAIIMIGLWIYIIYRTGGQGAISGWLGKAIIIYLLIAGYQSAREAHRIKKELSL